MEKIKLKKKWESQGERIPSIEPAASAAASSPSWTQGILLLDEDVGVWKSLAATLCWWNWVRSSLPMAG